MAGRSAYGTYLTISGSTVAGLTGISGPSVSADTIDVTAHDSADAYREFVAGLIDGGEISFEGNLISAAAGNVVMNAINARTTTACTIVFPGAGTPTWTFVGIPTAFETDGPHDGKIGISGSIKVTGKPSLA